MPADAQDSSESTAAAYAARLLRSLGLIPSPTLYAPREHPAMAWAASGLMELTGLSDGPPQMCPVPLAACADGALAALASLAPEGSFDGLSGARLLGERAAIMDLHRAGAVSPGGACRLYRAGDGWIALNLARDEDRQVLPAWLQLEDALAPDALPQMIAARRSHELVEQGRLLGLAVAADDAPGPKPKGWFALGVEGKPRQSSKRRALRVVDLSSLWAGPLCSHLLQRLGAEVIKVESPARPDGARAGHPGFFDLLNAGKKCVAVDPRDESGRRQLRALIAGADIVIEGSRPRGLRQLGIDAEVLVRDTPGLTWIAISGHGRGEPQENWVAYGDDAGVAAGLSHLMYRATGHHLICGDAIADPLAGLHAALAAWVSHINGGGRLLSLALSGVVAHCIAFDLPGSEGALRERQQQWTALAHESGVSKPRTRPPSGHASALGADTSAVLAGLGIAC
ncbi:CoA transferase [Nevskia soli]|uniref:CoA transferase n=1 Tax=Nevskia soli TaxID=418856 RepID=UPI00068BA1CA|nr:CoA transferase [Nevskia soli]